MIPLVSPSKAMEEVCCCALAGRKLVKGLRPQWRIVIRIMLHLVELLYRECRVGSVLERPASNLEGSNTRNPGIFGILSLGNFGIRILSCPKLGISKEILCSGKLGICISEFLRLSISKNSYFRALWSP